MGLAEESGLEQFDLSNNPVCECFVCPEMQSDKREKNQDLGGMV